MHGGPNGFDLREWTQTTRADSQLFKADDAAFPTAESEAIFYLDSPDGDQGCPSALRIEALFQILSAKSGAGELMIAYRAVLVGDSAKPTPISSCLSF